MSGVSIQERHIVIRDGRDIDERLVIVKVNQGRQKVPTLQRTRFTKKISDNASFEDGLKVLQEENPDLNLELISNEPDAILSITRTIYTKRNKKGDVISTVNHDIVHDGRTNKEREQIEINAEQGETNLIKSRLQGKFGDKIKFTHQTKAQLAKPKKSETNPFSCDAR